MNITQHSAWNAWRFERGFAAALRDGSARPNCIACAGTNRRHPRLPCQRPTSAHRIRSGGVRGERQREGEPGSSAQGQHAEH
ncbi:hypothetical protein CEXT_725561 [Caerostris extrusa]|uniref:Uncharacterized protein n=1 Tax=Caerostris extrusa TaxID=172846 RepID=A0AAV4QHW0_CAEEX|nr:hypothetical protein CEXT_725561 [Caerostris extrusa]